jgi:3-oxoacyl-(acyl-carrier-protein) synthase
MNIFIAGTGWVTPLGSDIDEVWSRLAGGEMARADQVSDCVAATTYTVFRVPDWIQKALPQHPRLRRASAISRFAAAAGIMAMQDASGHGAAPTLSRTGLVFAVANGGVIYTKRFFHDVATTGAQSASPLLFPETVFNAPASHLAAILGIEGVTYTVVGDGSIGLVAIKLAEDLIRAGSVDSCLVVAAEEADWLLCDAYHKWRLLRSTPPIELFCEPPRGTILSEGAGAVLLGRTGPIRVEAIGGGTYFSSRTKLAAALASLAHDLASPEVSVAIGSANGTFIDQMEKTNMAANFPGASYYCPTPALGESVGASGMWELIIGCQALKTGLLPPSLPGPSAEETKPNKISHGQAVVIGCGMNQQVGGLRITL